MSCYLVVRKGRGPCSHYVSKIELQASAVTAVIAHTFLKT